MTTSIHPLILLHEGLQRKGPGDAACTREALAQLRSNLPERPRVADLGCGSGASALVLAEALQVPVLALDFAPGFIQELEARAAEAGLGDLIDARTGDMAEPPVEPGSLDLIWSEGAVYSVGFEPGLARWRELLRPGGCVAVTELSWFGDARPPEAAAFFAEGYPEMASIDENVARTRRAGFETFTTFRLPASTWWNYYRPLLARCDELEPGADPDLAATIAETRRESEIFRRHEASYGYVFYLMKAEG
jgi:serine/threonine-protein kinase HipA